MSRQSELEDQYKTILLGTSKDVRMETRVKSSSHIDRFLEIVGAGNSAFLTQQIANIIDAAETISHIGVALGGEIPVWVFAETTIPVDLTSDTLLGMMTELFGRATSASMQSAFSNWKRYCDATESDTDNYPSVAPAASVVSSFAGSLAAATLQSASASMPSSISITVACRSHGYTINWTDQYWMSPVVLGSNPSTPVSGHLPQANYRFGGRLKAGRLKWDRNINPVSPTSRSISLSSF